MIVIPATEDNLKQLPEYCKQCFHVMLHSYNEVSELTMRYCSNDYCPLKISQRILFIVKDMEISGIGPKTALSYCKDKSELAIYYLSVFAPNHSLTPQQVINYLFIRDLGKQTINQLYGSCSSVEEIINKPTKYQAQLIKEYTKLRDYIERGIININESYYKPKYQPLHRLKIAITGEILGYKNREDIAPFINYLTDGIVQIHVTSSVSNNTNYVISNSVSSTNKFRRAQELGIPIVTTEIFIYKMLEKAAQSMKENIEYLKELKQRLQKAGLKV